MFASMAKYFWSAFECMRGSRNFCVGVQALRPENHLDVFVFSPQLILQFTEGFITEKTILFQGSRGGPNANFYRNPYSLRFSMGVRISYPPSGSAHGMNAADVISRKHFQPG